MTNSSMCSVTEYPLNDPTLDLAIATLRVVILKMAELLIKNAKSLLMCKMVKV